MLRFAGPVHGSLDGIIVTTGDGLWRTAGQGTRIERFALQGMRIGSLTSGSHADQLIGVVDHERIFPISRSDPSRLTWLEHWPCCWS